MKLIGDENGSSEVDLYDSDTQLQLKAGKDLHWDYVLKEEVVGGRLPEGAPATYK